MPIKPHSYQKKVSFNENYYRNKFVLKARELFQYSERHPNDEETKIKLKFINDVLEKEDSKLPIIWKNWEKDSLYYPINTSSEQNNKDKN